MSNLPSPNGSNGRQSSGQFGPGNKFGKGNPTAKRAAEFRQTLLAAVSTDDIQAVVAKLVEMARAGDIHAIRELLDRSIGKPAPVDESLLAMETEREQSAIDREFIAKLTPEEITVLSRVHRLQLGFSREDVCNDGGYVPEVDEPAIGRAIAGGGPTQPESDNREPAGNTLPKRPANESPIQPRSPSVALHAPRQQRSAALPGSWRGGW